MNEKTNKINELRNINGDLETEMNKLKKIYNEESNLNKETRQNYLKTGLLGFKDFNLNYSLHGISNCKTLLYHALCSAAWLAQELSRARHTLGMSRN